MLKTLLAGTAVLAMASATPVLAQPAQTAPAGNEAQARSPHPVLSAEDLQAFAESRIAALKAGLRLTPEQEKNWPALETALRGVQDNRLDQMQRRRVAQGDNAAQRDSVQRDSIESMRNLANAMAARAASLKQVAEAAEPLYRSLNDGQKRRFDALLRQAMGSTHDDSRHGVGPRGKRGHDMRGRGPGPRGMGPRDGMGPRGGMGGQ
jgi:hypothetical protein